MLKVVSAAGSWRTESSAALIPARTKSLAMVIGASLAKAMTWVGTEAALPPSVTGPVPSELVSQISRFPVLKTVPPE